MPPKNAAKDQLRLASICSSTENLQILGRVTTIFTWPVSVLQEDTICNKSDHDDEENSAERSRPCERWWKNIYTIVVPLNASMHGRQRPVQIPTATLSSHCQSLHDRRTPKRVNSQRTFREIRRRYMKQQSYFPRSDPLMIGNLRVEQCPPVFVPQRTIPKHAYRRDEKLKPIQE